MFVLSSREQLSVWDQLEIILSRWRDIERLSKEPGPYIYTVTRTSIRQVV